MPRRITYGFLIALLLISVLFWWVWPRVRLTPEKIAKVQVGMNLTEAKELLGEPVNTADYLSVVCFEQRRPNDPLTRVNSYQPKSAFLPRIDITNVGILDNEQKSIWVERKQGFCVITDDQGIITKMESFSVDSNGGGIWNWMKSQYQSWTSPAPPPLPAAPLPVATKPANK